MSSAKINQALGHIKDAEKALKTGLFKWNPDYDTAASEYTKAATCFKLAGLLEKCKDAYLKGADMQEKLGSLFHSGKLYTQAAGIASDMQQMEEAINLMEKASILYREHGAPDTAATTISKAAKMCEESLPTRSVEMYLKAADLCEDDEKLRDATGYLNKASCLEIKRKRYMQAAKIIKRHIELIKSIGNVQMGYRIVLNLVITHLADEDTVAAEEAYKIGFNLSGFGESDEAMYCEHFVKAYEEGDGELLSRTKSQPTVTNLDTAYARLARSLTIAEQIGGVSTVTDASEKVATESLEENEKSNNTNGNGAVEADEWGEGLC